jgi:hypothetical protein
MTPRIGQGVSAGDSSSRINAHEGTVESNYSYFAYWRNANHFQSIWSHANSLHTAPPKEENDAHSLRQQSALALALTIHVTRR